MPLLAVGWGWLVLDERLSWNAALALALTVISIACVKGQVRPLAAWALRHGTRLLGRAILGVSYKP
jgi:threonine/homoserine efflux transporter RhtA